MPISVSRIMGWKAKGLSMYATAIIAVRRLNTTFRWGMKMRMRKVPEWILENPRLYWLNILYGMIYEDEL